MSRRPNVFIIGAPKAGTTSLYEYLEGHPEIFMSPVKEPFYFSPDVLGGLRRRFTYGEDERQYLDLFAGARDKKRVGEASTRYLASRRAPALIRAFEPDARIIVMLRNPVDMVYAMHNERVSAGVEEITDFEKAIAADDDRAAGRRLRPGANAEWAVYRNAARLSEHLQAWLDVFSSDQVHIIVFDDFAADTPGEFRKVLEFLDVGPDYVPPSFAVRRRSHRRREGIVRLLLDNRAARFVSHRLLPAALGRTTAMRIVWSFRQSRLNRIGFSRPPISTALRRQLEDEFKPDVARLSVMLDRDLGQLWFGRPALPEGADAKEVAAVS